jgi:hypothetical protein
VGELDRRVKGRTWRCAAEAQVDDTRTVFDCPHDPGCDHVIARGTIRTEDINRQDARRRVGLTHDARDVSAVTVGVRPILGRTDERASGKQVRGEPRVRRIDPGVNYGDDHAGRLGWR